MYAFTFVLSDSTNLENPKRLIVFGKDIQGATESAVAYCHENPTYVVMGRPTKPDVEVFLGSTLLVNL